jgi:hypothetical protein
MLRSRVCPSFTGSSNCKRRSKSPDILSSALTAIARCAGSPIFARVTRELERPVLISLYSKKKITSEKLESFLWDERDEILKHFKVAIIGVSSGESVFLEKQLVRKFAFVNPSSTV